MAGWVGAKKLPIVPRWLLSIYPQPAHLVRILNSVPGLITRREKLAYGCGDMASNLFYQVFNMFLLYYYTDVVGLAAASVGTMFLVTRFVDAFKSPLVGLLADRTTTRWGKFRPYLLWGAIPYGIAGYLVFLNPAFSVGGKLVYAYVSYLVVTMAYAIVNVPYAALMGVMSSDSSERTSLASYRFAFAFSGGLIVTSTLLPLKNLLGQGNDLTGYRLTIGIFAVLAVALLWCTFRFTRERVQPTKEDKGSVGGDIRSLVKNRPWLILFVVAVGTLSMVAVRNAATIYYLKYYMGSEGKASWCLTIGMLGQLIGCLLTRSVLRLGSKEKVLRVLIAMVVPLLAAMYWLPSHAFGAVLVLQFLVALLMGPKPVIVWSMYADAADYGEWKFGRRTTGLVFAAANFANGIGLALGGALGGWMLSSVGFLANSAQTPEALVGIRLMFSVIPAGLAAISFAALFWYPLSDERVRTISKNLRRG